MSVILQRLSRLQGEVVRHGSRIPQLDGIRGLAILMVLLVHARLWADSPRHVLVGGLDVTFFVQNARLGVNLFFVLSGYLLFSQYIGRHLRHAPHPTYTSFLRRRLSRIVPAYYVLLFAAFLVIPASQPLLRLDRVEGLENLISHVFFVHNFSRPFSASVSVVWSLGVEMQFYLLLPLMAALTLKGQAWKRRILIAWLLSILLYIAMALLGPFSPLRVEIPPELSLPYHANEFMTGYLAAAVLPLLQRSPRFIRHRQRIALLLQIAGGLLIVYMMRVGSSGFTGTGLEQLVRDYLWYPMVGVGFAMLILGAVNSEGWLSRLWTSGALVFLGITSYGIFLWHYMLMPNLANLTFIQPIADPALHILVIFLMALPLSALVGYISYALVESPFLKKHATPRPDKPVTVYPTQRVTARGGMTPESVVAHEIGTGRTPTTEDGQGQRRVRDRRFR